MEGWGREGKRGEEKYREKKVEEDTGREGSVSRCDEVKYCMVYLV